MFLQRKFLNKPTEGTDDDDTHDCNQLFLCVGYASHALSSFY